LAEPAGGARVWLIWAVDFVVWTGGSRSSKARDTAPFSMDQRSCIFRESAPNFLDLFHPFYGSINSSDCFDSAALWMNATTAHNMKCDGGFVPNICKFKRSKPSVRNVMFETIHLTESHTLSRLLVNMASVSAIPSRSVQTMDL